MPGLVDIASAIARGPTRERALVAVDGGDASGKTTYAAALAGALTDLARTVLVIHVDDFMQVPAVRHRRGRTSPEGYLHDSYDYEALTTHVLRPLGRGGSGEYRRACIDRSRETRLVAPTEYAAADTITIVEGLFLLRDELVSWWDYSILLDIPYDVTMARKSRRDGLALTPDSPLTRRYVEGQRLYPERYGPHQRATWVVPHVDGEPRS